MSGHLTLAPGKVTRSTRRSSERLHLGAACHPTLSLLLPIMQGLAVMTVVGADQRQPHIQIR